jgi:hypothetical protein
MKSILYGAFVWARRALNRPFRRFSARAVIEKVRDAVQREDGRAAAAAGGSSPSGRQLMHAGPPATLSAVYESSMAAYWTLQASPGRHCHSILLLTVIGCDSLGIYTVILLSLLSFRLE